MSIPHARLVVVALLAVVVVLAGCAGPISPDDPRPADLEVVVLDTPDDAPTVCYAVYDTRTAPATLVTVDCTNSPLIDIGSYRNLPHDT